MACDLNELTSCLPGSRPFRDISFHPANGPRRMGTLFPYAADRKPRGTAKPMVSRLVEWQSLESSPAGPHPGLSQGRPQPRPHAGWFPFFVGLAGQCLVRFCAWMMTPHGATQPPPPQPTLIPLQSFFFKARNSRKISLPLLLVFPL